MAYQDYRGLLDCQELQHLTAHQGGEDLLNKLNLVVLPVFQALEVLLGPKETWDLLASKEMKMSQEPLAPKEIKDQKENRVREHLGQLVFVEGLEHLVLVALLSK